MTRAKRTTIVAVAAFLGLGIVVSRPELAAQGSAVALDGSVTSPQEGPMEGVVVSARGKGSNHTVSVVSDASGRYRFPRTHLTPGPYAVTIRAVGYDLVGPGTAEVPATGTATLDLRLTETGDLGGQLSSLEWALSWPLTVEQREKIIYQGLSCAYCHSYRRIMRSRHTAEEFVPVISRMLSYYPDGTAASDDGRGAAQRFPSALVEGHTGGASSMSEMMAKMQFGSNYGSVPKTELGEWLATVNLSGGRATWEYPLKTLPRPTGAGTQVIVTEWDLPRSRTTAHDLDVDSKGTIWYTDESSQTLGKLVPSTNTFTEYPMPPVPSGHLAGTRDVVVDQDDNPWFPMRTANHGIVLVKFDAKTEQPIILPGVGGQFMYAGGDGKIWAGLTRVDPKTHTVEARFEWRDAPNTPPGNHGLYVDHLMVTSQGDPYLPDFAGGYIIGIEASTKTVTFYPTAGRGTMPRRGRMDAQDRLWFGEYSGDRIGMLDTRTKQMQEWPTRQYFQPYTASIPDRHGYVYASSNMAERIVRLNPQTGETVEYQMPGNFDGKKLVLDPAANRPTLWMSNVRSARILRLEVLGLE